MGISVFNIKKWSKMIFGKSILHVNQSVGKIYSKDQVRGYYNDLTEKVTKDNEHLEITDVFPHKSETASEGIKDVFFPIAIFQYGLGAYDLYLMNRDEHMLEKFKKHVDWAFEHQDRDGSWDNFGFIYPKYKYSAMAQGEGCSLLLRAYIEFHDIKYFNAAKKAVDFMLTPVEQGGTAKYIDGKLCLLEYSHLPAVLNGWIFAIFGLYDMTLVCKDVRYVDALNNTLNYLEEKLELFDCKYWSMYDLGGKIASPFYHSLHIAQMQALYEISGKELFSMYQQKWSKQQKNIIKRTFAFIKKSVQKIME